MKGIPHGDGDGDRWAAVERWRVDALASNPSLRNRYFKVGEDDDGTSVKMKLKHFIKYMAETKDDSPLYVFDSAFDEDKHAKSLLDDFRVPSYFQEDLFHLVGERRRPPYRWFLIGPERSGTTVHYDPLGTSAWNTLLFGEKRWVLFPPHVPKRVVKGTELLRKGEDDEAAHYFMYILPRIKQKAAAVATSSRKDDDDGDDERRRYRNFACYEFTQKAGETVFVPYGWWHAVLNLTDTVGVTQNFCSRRNFDEVWRKTRKGRKKMAYKWLLRLEEHHPRLHERAKELNARDDFVMKYDPAQVRARRDEERRKRDAKRARREKRHKERRESPRPKRSRDRDGDSTTTDDDRRMEERRSSTTPACSDSSRESASPRRRKQSCFRDAKRERPSRPVSP